jgi:uncharacterized membrane protein YdbT with pleckstrin-like domain
VSYVDEHLLPGERVVHRARLHPIIFAPGAVITIGSLPLIAMSDTRTLGLGGLLIGLLALAQAYVNSVTSEFAVTTTRLVFKIGWLSRKTIELQLAKVEGLTVDQPLLGRALDYGTLVVSGTGGTKEPFAHIQAPIVFRKQVQQQAEAMAAQGRERSSSESSPTSGESPAGTREERDCPHCAERILAKAARRSDH